jgi:hypothetical protein
MWADIQEAFLIIMWQPAQWAAVAFIAMGIFAAITETWALLLKALTRWF